MPITLNGDTGITTPSYGGTDAAEYLVPVTAFKNRIINGAMQIDQRNAGASVTISASGGGQYTLDRWLGQASQNSKMTIQQNAGSVTPPTGFKNYIGVTSSSAYSVLSGDYFSVRQAIEGFNTADLEFGTANASAVTLSFWVRSSLTGTFGGSLQSFFNGSSTRTYPFTYTISSTNTWEQKTITVSGDITGTWVGATNGLGLWVAFGLGSGSTFSGTANSWQSGNFIQPTGTTSVVGTNGATFYITGVQLEKGSTATSFDYRPYGTELALCQRYYYVHAQGNNKQIMTTSYYSTTQVEGMVKFSASMRTAPSLVVSTGTDYYIVYRNNGSDVVNSLSIGSEGTTESIKLFNNTEASGTAGNAGNMVTNNASSLVAFSAEL